MDVLGWNPPTAGHLSIYYAPSNPFGNVIQCPLQNGSDQMQFIPLFCA